MFVYRSGDGTAFDLSGDEGYWADPDALRVWKYTYEVANGEPRAFTLEPTEIQLPVSVLADPGGGNALVDALDRALERDIRLRTPGTLEVDGFTTQAYAVGVAMGDDSYSDTELEREITFLLPRPEWVAETTFAYKRMSDDYAAALSFPFDFSADMQTASVKVDAENATGSPADVRLEIHGPCTNPTVTVADNVYGCDVTVPDGATLVIDGRDRSRILLTLRDGSVHNVFAKRIRGARGSGRYCFEQAPPGLLAVEWDNSFDFELYVYDVRGCPPC